VLLPAGVLIVELPKSLSVVAFAVIVELRLDFPLAAVGGGFKNFIWEENFKNNFFRAAEVEALLRFLGCV
jgi:hypothetical protein